MGWLMRQQRVFVSTLLMLAATGMVARASHAAPLETYGALPSVDEMSLSADGTKDAYVATKANDRLIVIQDLTSGKVIRVLKAGDAKLRGLCWAGNDDLLITYSRTMEIPNLSGPEHEFSTVIDLNIATGAMATLLDKAPDGIKMIQGAVAGLPQIRLIDGAPVVFVTGTIFPVNRSQLALFRVNLKDHRTSLIDGSAPAARSWTLDENGVLVARDQYDEATRRWLLELKSAQGWAPTEGLDASIERPYLAGLSADGASVLVVVPSPSGNRVTGVPLQPGKPQIEVARQGSGVLDDAVTGRAVAILGADVHFLDPGEQRFWAGLQHAYAGETIRLVSRAAGGAFMIIQIDGPRDGVSFALVNMKTRHADWIGDVYGGLKADDLAPVSLITYPATDGLTIPAYLTLPRGRDAKNLPLVVLPHGGPAVRDNAGFDWWPQALASQGYAVLQPEYRGSAGFGEKFLEAGYGQWGRKMQTDLSDGVRYLVHQGTIDPKRVAIAGASYGGYAALAGAAFDPGIYRCAIAVAGPADLQVMMRKAQTDMRREDSTVTRYWMRFMGATATDDPELNEISPAKHADRITIPVLLIHGSDDTVVPHRQSEIMQQAMEDAHKPVTLITLEHEDHWLSRAETRIQMLKASADFLKANDPPG